MTRLFNVETFVILAIWVNVVVAVVVLDDLQLQHLTINNRTNPRPIIGVLAQESFGNRTKFGQSYIAASYVKFLEGSGARVAPVKINQTKEYYEFMFRSLNGIVLPGGAQNQLYSGYANAARFFIVESVKAYLKGDHFPVWGECLGYEELFSLVIDQNIVSPCENTHNVSRNISFGDEFRRSRMFEKAPEDLIEIMRTKEVAAHFHHKCVYESTFNQFQRLRNVYRVLSTDVDGNGTRYIAAVEGRFAPIYGLQWHPEKNLYEWHPESVGSKHTEDAYRVTRYFGDFLVSEARRSNHNFKDYEEEMDYLIFNYPPVYTGKLLVGKGHFDLCYFIEI